MKSIIILASGTGSNAEQIIKHFEKVPDVQVSALISDRSKSRALTMASNYGVKPIYIPIRDIREGVLTSKVKSFSPDLIVLAGFLRMIPNEITREFNSRIVNVHPSLLPNHGGKGMFGMNVHRSVIEAGDSVSGISIHYVNERYDEGRMIAQYYCDVSPDDTPESLQSKVLELEHYYFPLVIEKLLER
jgi:phosphoribosylglycinamide formyltransferase-1